MGADCGGAGSPLGRHAGGRIHRRAGTILGVSKPPIAGNPIDAFILQTLRAKQLEPSKPLDRAQLLRRVTYDLTGLPPTPGELDSFLKDQARDAYEKVVDRLLESPHYGERWASKWLDVVRYADTNGFELDQDRPHAWVVGQFEILGS